MPVDVAAPSRVLVRWPNWLGDTLMARPALSAVRASWPAARILAAGPPALLELLAGDAFADAVCDARAPDAPARARAFGPEVAIVMPPSFSSAWFAWRSGARVRVGFDEDARGGLLTHRVRRRARGDGHLSGEYLELAGSAGARTAAPPAGLRARAVDIERRDVRRGAMGGPAGPWAVLAPGAQYGPAKRWPAERFAELARRLTDLGLEPVLCGGSEDREVAERVADLSGVRCWVVAGQTSLGEQLAWCASAGVCVCNDSGLAHLSAASGAPTVVIFGSTSSAWTAPCGAHVRVVQRATVCSPCFARSCAIGMPCLTGVAVRQVLAAVAEVRSGANAGEFES